MTTPLPPDLAAMEAEIAGLHARAARLRESARYADRSHAEADEARAAEMDAARLRQRLEAGKARRARDLKAIHAAARRAGLEGGAYRHMLAAHGGGKASSADMTAAERGGVLNHLRAAGAMPGRKPRPPEDRSRLMAKIDAQLAGGGRERTYVEAGILPRMFGAQAPKRLEWCTPEQLRKIVAALNYDAKRRAAKGGPE